MEAATIETGEIRADSAYPLEDFKKRSKQGDYALRMARRKGLKVRRSGGRAYVLGSDWLDYLSKQGGE